MEERDPLTQAVIGAAIEVHRIMGPGLIESVYQKCLEEELRLRSISCEAQVRRFLEYKGKVFDEDYLVNFNVPVLKDGLKRMVL